MTNLEETSGGYFAEDNLTSDDGIQKEVDQILRDKESLLSFKMKMENGIFDVLFSPNGHYEKAGIIQMFFRYVNCVLVGQK